MICGKDWIDERLLKRIAVTARWVGARPKRVSEHRVRTSEGAMITRGEITEILARAFPDLITTQAKRNLSSRSGIGGVVSAT